MQRKLTLLTLLSSLVLTVACDRQAPRPGVEDRDRVPEVAEQSDPYSAAMLEQFKEAVPSVDQLKAPAPSSDMEAQLGDPAIYPRLAAPQVHAVNLHVAGLILTLEVITALPPTVYNSDTQEFVWGPWENKDSALVGDHALVYIKDNGEDADFRYSYAFLRGVGNDMATYQPVIWGASTPGEEPRTGKGLVLYDFEANKAFEDAHNPDVDDSLARGRFAIAFGRGEADDGSGSMVSLVVSSFRDFRPDGEDGGTANMDQMYGHVDGADGNKVDFVSILAEGNVTPEDAPDSALEDIDLRLAFLNGGHGRAEAIVSGGDLTSDTGESVVLATECWDGLIARTYLNLSAEGEIAAGTQDGTLVIGQEGELELCGPIFENSLDDLHIPSLEDVEPEHLEALQNIAANGI
jgi:hypothetical protein